MLILILLFAFATTDPVKSVIIQHLDDQGITLFDPTENDQVWKDIGRE